VSPTAAADSCTCESLQNISLQDVFSLSELIKQLYHNWKCIV